MKLSFTRITVYTKTYFFDNEHRTKLRYERAIKYFQKSLRIKQAEEIEEKFESLNKTDAKKRHLERVSRAKRQQMLMDEARLLRETVDKEVEFQRRRIRVTHHILVKLHLYEVYKSGAGEDDAFKQASICLASENAIHSEERLETLLFLHKELTAL